MASLKKVWLVPWECRMGLSSLCMESAHPEEHGRIMVHERAFPAQPNKRNPLRHTVNLGLFADEDLEAIKKAIEDYLQGRAL